MSGGHFDYKQFYIDDIADRIEDYLKGHKLSECNVDDMLNDRWVDDDEKQYIKKHHHTMPNYHGYSLETLRALRRGVRALRKASVYAQRIDWLLSGDDCEESFKERLGKELKALKNHGNRKK